MTQEELYLRLPHTLQSVVLNAQGWLTRRQRYNREFFGLYDDYLSRVKWSADRVREFRDQRLLDFLCWADEHVPFYADRFAQAGYSPSEQGNLVGFDRVPVLEKATVQDIVTALRVDVGEPTIRVHTSGTTGGGLQFRCTYTAHREQWACWQRYRHWHGIRSDEPCAYFGGRSIMSVNQCKPPYWHMNWAGKQLMFSAYHLSPDTAGDYIEALRQSELRWIHGYPSAVALLASYMVERSERAEIKWVTLGAENVTAAQSAVIEAAFGVKPIQHYGMAEAVANISQWPDGTMRVDEDFAYTEFVPRTDGLFDIVGTNFTNRAFPLIRYRVGDIAELPQSNGKDMKFGRTVLQVDGRMEDYVVTNDGARLGRLDHIFKDCVNVREAQIVQRRKGYVTVNVVPNAKYSADDDRVLEREMRQRFGDRVTFEICHVDSIARTSRGKLRFVVSELDLADSPSQ